jgi:hypothetical protein
VIQLVVSLLTAVAGLTSGRAAWLWYRASQVDAPRTLEGFSVWASRAEPNRPNVKIDATRRCHANQIWPARRLEVPTQVQAAVAARHVRKASSRKTRSVRRDVRWRWTLKIPWRVDSG